MRLLTRLAVALGCLAAAAPAQVCDLTTSYTSNGTGAVGGAVYFTLTANQALAISSLELNASSPAGTPIGLQVFVAPNGFTGQVLNPGAWTPLAQDNGNAFAAGRGLPSLIPLSNVILLQPGIHGIALVARGFGHRYATGNPTNNFFSNSCMRIDMGAATDVPFSGSILGYRSWNGTIRAQAAVGNFADFTSTTPSGPLPLRLSFTDLSYTSSLGGITSWAWDFDGDQIIDSNAQSPSFTYQSCGRYSVTLTASDGLHPPSTITKSRYVSAEPSVLPVADFDANVYGGAPPLVVQFTDTSTGQPTQWSWDFDADGIADSTQQNPLWTFSTGGFHTIALRASNNCSSDTVTKRDFVHVIPNEECAAAIPLGLGLSGGYSNARASTSAPAWTCAAGGADLWFSFRAPCRGSYQIDTCTSTNYDSALEVFTGTCGNLRAIGCNDDSCGLYSVVAFSAMAGQSFLFRVGGWSNSQGSFRVRISLRGSGSITEVSPSCGSMPLEVDGTANLGSPLNFNVGVTSGTGLLWLGAANLALPICSGCTLGASFDTLFVQSSLQSAVPCDPTLAGATFFIQGAEVGANGACPIGAPFPFPISLTRTLRIQIGS
ncbi:MAG: PKD domain-containing protein [Planctomycetes bacterium]|nr:PKD domain-containing protein [Planctomycetota bacterium]